MTCSRSRMHLQRPPLSLKSLRYVPLLRHLCSWVMFRQGACPATDFPLSLRSVLLNLHR